MKRLEQLQRGAYIAIIGACIAIFIGIITYFGFNPVTIQSSREVQPVGIPQIPVGSGIASMGIYGAVFFLYMKYENLKEDYEGISKDISEIKDSIRDMRKEFTEYLLRK